MPRVECVDCKQVIIVSENDTPSEAVFGDVFEFGCPCCEGDGWVKLLEELKEIKLQQ